MNYKLEKLKKDLDTAINEPNVSADKINQICNDIDDEIKNTYISDNMSFEEKCKFCINRNDKEDVIQQIRDELLNKYYNITTLEVNILSENIYDYCCLMINDIPKDDIIRYMLDKNNKIHDDLTEKQLNSMKVNANLKYYRWLIDKYSKVLKNNDND